MVLQEIFQRVILSVKTSERYQFECVALLDVDRMEENLKKVSIVLHQTVGETALALLRTDQDVASCLEQLFNHIRGITVNENVMQGSSAVGMALNVDISTEFQQSIHGIESMP